MNKKILVFSNGEKIGDGIIKLKLLHEINTRLPGYKLYWLTNNGKTVYSDILKFISSNYIDKIFDAIWRDGLNMNDQNIMDKIIKNMNINPKTFFLRASNQNVKTLLKSKTDEAFNKGIFGAPSFLINNKIFWGQDRLDFVIAEAKK